MTQKKRKERGSDVFGSKLTEEKVRSIRKRYVQQGEQALDLAHEFGVSVGNILAIATRHSWRWVDDGIEDTRPRAEKYRRGSSLSFSKLTESQVVEIRQLHREGWAMRALARQFGVEKSTIKQIVVRKTWTHV